MYHDCNGVRLDLISVVQLRYREQNFSRDRELNRDVKREDRYGGIDFLNLGDFLTRNCYANTVQK